MLKQKRFEQEQIFVLDTSALYSFLGWIKRLTKALRKGELDGKKVNGEIVVPESVFQDEVNKKYFKFLERKKQGTLRKNQKALFRKVKRAKFFLDKELNSANPVCRVQRVTKEIAGAMRIMQAESKFHKLENPPNDNDFLIIATVMFLIRRRERPRVRVVSWDGGILMALKYCGVSLRGGNPKNLFPSYWKWRRFRVKLGLIKDLKKGD